MKILLFLLMGVQFLISVPLGQPQSFTVKKQREFIATGTVVDDAGNAVENAFVWIYEPPSAESIDQILPGHKTTKSGFFSLEMKTNAKQVILFINDAEPEGYFSPLFYLPEWKRQRIRALKGINLSVSRRANKPREIVLPFRYSRVIADLTSLFGNNAEKNFVGNINLVIRDDKGRVVNKDSLTKSAFNETQTELKLVLPVCGNETTWGLRIEYMNSYKETKAFEYKLKLKKLGCKKLYLNNASQSMTECE